MFTKEEITILQDAIRKCGIRTQINKAKEELSELHLELDRLQSSPFKTNDAAIITEIADVTIMCHQLSMIYGEDEVKKKIDYKIKRLETRLLCLPEPNKQYESK